MSADPARPTAAVTGASRGIGRAIAWEMAAHGYRVFVLARAVAELDELAVAARAEGWQVEPIELDIADDDSRRQAIRAIHDATNGYGVDVLVNNAGFGQFGPLEEISVEQFRRQLEVNVIGLLAFTQPFLPAMRTRRAGTVINLSSAAGRVATPFMGAYNASKFALEGLSDALRLELSPFGVRVVLIAPGPIRSSFGDMARQVNQENERSPYAPYLHGWHTARRGTDRFERGPEVVARVVLRAVQSTHPRPRYTITVPALLGATARRLVPDTVTDWVVRQALGLRPAR